MANFYAVYPPSNASSSSAPTIVSGSGTAGTPATGVLTVQGITGGTPINVTPTNAQGRSAALQVYSPYTTTPVTTAAYVQIVASTSAIVNWLSIFDSSGSAMILAVGASGSEVPQLYLPPGGMTEGYPLYIPSGSRIAYKALDNNASSGELIITGLN